jgi:beta-glucosidase
MVRSNFALGKGRPKPLQYGRLGAVVLMGPGILRLHETAVCDMILPLFSRRFFLSFVATVAVLLGAGRICAQSATVKAVQLDADEARAERVDHLVGQMTLEEKVAQMQNHAAAIPRLGIPAYDYWNEGLHGSARSGYSTLFPQAIGMAATWDAGLIHQVAGVISVEARAKHSEAVLNGLHEIYYGLTIWSPNINIFRDPRWGRGQETYGEDPFLTSRLGVAFVSGLQGDSKEYLRTVSTPKHFAVHSGPESTRHTANVDPTAHDLEDTYLPAFRATVMEGHAQSVMCAYNSIDGAPACANQHLLGDILRGSWKFDGFVTSDCAAVTDIAEGHKFAKDLEQASVDAVRAGTDTSCGAEFATLSQAVKDGLIRESELDTAVKRLFMARFRLGLFNPAKDVDYEHLPFSEVDSAAHEELALKTALESMVLLKNDGALPLKPSVKTIAVIGPNAASLAALEGNYNAVPSHPVTPLDGLRALLGDKVRVLYAQGSSYVSPLSVPVPESVLRNGAETGLKGEYFATSDFSGKPVVVRTDKQIDFDWNGASPASNVPAKAFSVRWTGTISASAPGDASLTLTLAHCYPCRDEESYAVYVDGKPIGQKLFPAQESRASAGPMYPVHFADTKAHEFRVDYSHKAPLFGAGISLEWVPSAPALQAEAVKVAEQADAVVAFVGLSPNLEGEEMPIKVEGFLGGDRSDIQLPRAQEEMLEAVERSLSKTGKPMIVVLMNGSALAVNWAQEHAAAVLEAWYPGEAGGTAIAETLLGEYNPAGRLPVTFYKSIDQLPAFDDYAMKNRTYRYSTALPLYAFGDGLSYTSFVYSKAALSAASIRAGDSISVKACVTNTGQQAGDEVVEAYLTAPMIGLAPKLALVGFARVHLAAGESREVMLTIEPRQLSEVDGAGARAILPGQYAIHVGGHQPASGDAGLSFTMTGTKALPE